MMQLHRETQYRDDCFEWSEATIVSLVSRFNLDEEDIAHLRAGVILQRGTTSFWIKDNG